MAARLEVKLGLSVEDFEAVNLDPKIRYIANHSNLVDLTTLDPDARELYFAALNGDIEKVRTIIANLRGEPGNRSLGPGLFGAGQGGHLNIVQLITCLISMEDRGPELEYVFKGIGMSGNIDTYRKAIEWNMTIGNIESTIGSAAMVGHLALVQDIIAHFSTSGANMDCQYHIDRILTSGLYAAAIGGNYEIAKFLYDQYEDYEYLNDDDMFHDNALHGGNIAIIDMSGYEDKDAISDLESLTSSCFATPQAFQHIVEKYSSEKLDQGTLVKYFLNSVQSGNRQMIRYLSTLFDWRAEIVNWNMSEDDLAKLTDLIESKPPMTKCASNITS